MNREQVLEAERKWQLLVCGHRHHSTFAEEVARRALFPVLAPMWIAGLVGFAVAKAVAK